MYFQSSTMDQINGSPLQLDHSIWKKFKKGVCVKWICRKRNLSNSDYVLSLINQGLKLIGYKLVLTYLRLLTKILVRQTILNPLDFWEIKSHDFNTRSSGKVRIYAREMKQKRREESFFLYA